MKTTRKRYSAEFKAKAPSRRTMAAVEDHLDYPALPPAAFGVAMGRPEFLEQQLHHAVEFALLMGRKMIEIGAHQVPLRDGTAASGISIPPLLSLCRHQDRPMPDRW